MNESKCRKYGWWVLLVVVCFSFSALVQGEEVAQSKDSAAAPDTAVIDQVQMLKGDLETIKAPGLTRISLNDPDVADIINADDKEILLMGKGIGQTPMFIWDSRGKRTVMIHVYNQNLDLAQDRLKRLFKASEITGINTDIDDKEGKIIISGSVLKEKKDDFDKIIEPFSDSVMNLARSEDIQDLIQVDLEFIELNTTLLKNLGIDWTAGSSSSTLAFTYPETIPGQDGGFPDLFKLGDFKRTSALLATVNALVEQGKGRVLSKPKLVVVSGQEASFLVGGQIPFRTTTTTGTSVQESIEFKSYGIGMNITPTIKRGRIDVLLGIDISDVDPSTAIGGNKDVAFVTRNANTRLLLDDRQTIILAGLIKHSDSEKKKKVPLLGDIPGIGLFFKNKSNPTANQDTELVISLTPTILAQSKPKPDQEMTMTPPAPVTSASAASAPSPGASAPETEEQIDLTSSFPVPSIKNEKQPTNIPKNMEGYVKSIQNKIANAIVYPQEAKDYGWEGTVRLGLLILSDGTLAFASVKESSGHEIFDEYALNTAKQIAPYSSFPADSQLQELNVTIPIVYSLESN